jgi:hypothetical protein
VLNRGYGGGAITTRIVAQELRVTGAQNPRFIAFAATI